MRKIMSVLFVSILVMGMLSGCSKATSEQPVTETPAAVVTATFPERALEFVACYSPGGGHDIMLRTMTRILQEEKIVETPINVVNKPGGSGAVGMAYVDGHSGDGHYLMASTSAFLTTPLTTEVGVHYSNYTPIARFGIDPELLLVNSKSTFTTLEEILKSDKVLNVGGTGIGGMEHIVFVTMEKATGKDFNYVPFQGDGEVVAALMGSQVDLIIANPNAAYDYIKSGDFRAIAITTEERAEIMPDIPTFKEKGYDIVLSLFRGVVAPANISEEAKAYYTEMVRKLVKTDAWKNEYLKNNLIVEAYLEGDEYAKYLDEMNSIYKTTLTELGIIK